MEPARRDGPRAVADFELGAVLGSSERTTVFRGTRAGKTYAVKVWRGEGASAQVATFRREAAALARLDHPALVKVVEVGSAKLQKLLANDPDDRYQTARGVAADLTALSELEAQAHPLLGTGDRDSVRALAETPFVGRKAERARLLAAWSGARAGRGRFVQVEGDAGSGKSRLVHELVTQARSDGARHVPACRAGGHRRPTGGVTWLIKH